MVCILDVSGYLLAPAVPTVSQHTCPRPAACYCVWPYKLYCGGKTSPLSQVPTFPSNSYAKTLNMTDNHITSLPRNAFSHLTRVQTIYLNRNRISSVDPTAFSGLYLYTLDLSHNQLQTVPESLKNLNRLRELRLEFNPIKQFQPSVEFFAYLGSTLQALHFGSPDLQAWPAHLNLMRYLKTLSVHGFKMTSLPQDAFNGLSNLQNLNLENTGLPGIPASVCNIHTLKSLNFTANHISGGGHLFPSCHMQQLTSLYLDGTSLTSFPSIFSMFPSMDKLYIHNNPGLTSIPSQAIPTGKSTHIISLNGNGFTTVPLALEKLTNLRELELDNNKITSVSRALNFPSVWRFSLNGNPIHSFSSSAFTKMSYMSRLYLANTGQTTIPQALSAIHMNSWTIDLQNNPIHCTCALKWVKHWIETYTNTGTLWDFHVHKLLGTCQGSKTTLDSYIKQCH